MPLLKLARRRVKKRVLFPKKQTVVSKAVKAYVKKATISVADVRYKQNQSTSYGSGGDTMSTTITFINVCTMPSVGDYTYERDGDSIVPLAFRLWGHCIPYDTYNIVRFVLFQFMGDLNIAGPAATSMFNTSQINTSGYVTAPYAPLRKEQKGEYHVLYDSGPLFMALASAAYLNGNAVKPFDVNISRNKLRKIKFTPGSTSCIGGIYLAVMSDSSAVGHPSIQWLSELSYVA